MSLADDIFKRCTEVAPPRLKALLGPGLLTFHAAGHLGLALGWGSVDVREDLWLDEAAHF